MFTKKIAAVAAISLALGAVPATAAFADVHVGNSYDGTYSVEVAFLWYNGAVWISPCYTFGGQHDLAGYMRYYIPGYWDTGRLYTPAVTGPSNCAKHEKDTTFQDTLDPNAPATQFLYGFSTVASNVW